MKSIFFKCGDYCELTSQHLEIILGWHSKSSVCSAICKWEICQNVSWKQTWPFPLKQTRPLRDSAGYSQIRPVNGTELVVNPLKMLITSSPLTELLVYSCKTPLKVQQSVSARAAVPAAALYGPQWRSLCCITSFDSQLVLPVQWLTIIWADNGFFSTKGTLSRCWACGFSVSRAGAGLRQPGENALGCTKDLI